MAEQAATFNSLQGSNVNFSFTSSEPTGLNTDALKSALADLAKQQKSFLVAQKKMIAEAQKEQDENVKKEKLLQIAKDAHNKEVENIMLRTHLEKLKSLEDEEKREKELKEKEKELAKAKQNNLEDKLKQENKPQPLPVAITNIQSQTEQEEPEKKEVERESPEELDRKRKQDSFFTKFGSYITMLPKTFQQPKQQSDGEQKNLGEQIMRVSFNPEGIKILRMLLDPIYKSLNAFTGDLDKGLKTLIEKIEGIFSGKSNGLMKLLLLFLSDLLFLSGKLGSLFNFLKTASVRLYTAFEEMFIRLLEGFKAYGKAFKRFLFDEPLNLLERMGLNVRKITSDVFAGIGNKIIEIKNGFVRALKLEELGTTISRFFNEKIIGTIMEMKTGIGELFETTIAEPFQRFVTNLKNIGKLLQTFFEPLITPFKEFAKIFKTGEGEGFFSRMVGSIGRVVEYAKSFVGPIQRLFSFLQPLFNLLKPFVALIEGLARIVSVEVISVVMGFVDAIRTFMDVWKDDKLSFVQKSVSIIAGFIGGIGSLVSDTIKAISSIVSLIPGGNWVSKNILDPVAKVIDSHNLGKDTANLFRGYNELQEQNKFLKELNSREDYIKSKNPKNLEERKKIALEYDDAMQKTGKPPKDAATPNPTSTPSPAPAPTYAPAPDNTPLPPKQDSVEIQKALQEQNKINQQLVSSMNQFQQAMMNGTNNNQQPVIINNSTQNVQSKETKVDMSKILTDVNTDKRVMWWKMSREYSPTM